MTTSDVVVGVGALASLARAGATDADLQTLGRVWQREVNRAVRRWQAEVEPLQQATLERQVEAAVHGGHPGALATLHTDAHDGHVLLHAAMRTLAAAGVDSVLAEARRAGLELDPPPPAAALSLADWARAAADVLTATLALGTGREALRLWRPGVVAADVVTGVRAYWDQLTDRGPRDVVGGALTRAQNLGRLNAYRQPHPGWTLQLHADETLDERTCGPCKHIDGKLLPTPEAAALAYGGAGYLFCEGRERCRGTVRGVWEQQERPEDVEHRATLTQLARLDLRGTR